MTDEEMKKFTDSIQNKLGKEASSLIMDDLGLLITDTDVMNQALQSRDKNISDLKERNEKLISTNASLFQQVGLGTNPNGNFNKVKEKKEEKKSISFRDCFDEKGNFKK